MGLMMEFIIIRSCARQIQIACPQHTLNKCMDIFILLLKIASFILGVIAYKTMTPVFVRSLLVLLFLTVLVETIELVFRNELGNCRTFLYNIFSILEMLLWSYFFYRLFENNRRISTLVMVVSICYFIFSLIEFIGPNGLKRFHVNSYRCYSISILLFSVIYLSQIIRKDEIYRPLNDCIFWLCAACIIFQSVFFVHLTVINMTAFQTDFESRRIFNLLLNLANIFYYSLICIAFSATIRNSYNSQLPSSKM